MLVIVVTSDHTLPDLASVNGRPETEPLDALQCRLRAINPSKRSSTGETKVFRKVAWNDSKLGAHVLAGLSRRYPFEWSETAAILDFF
jgi:hypothetical protein